MNLIKRKKILLLDVIIPLIKVEERLIIFLNLSLYFRVERNETLKLDRLSPFRNKNNNWKRDVMLTVSFSNSNSLCNILIMYYFLYFLNLILLCCYMQDTTLLARQKQRFLEFPLQKWKYSIFINIFLFVNVERKGRINVMFLFVVLESICYILVVSVFSLCKINAVILKVDCYVYDL